MAPDGKEVRVWSTVGGTLPIPDTYANIKFSFGHERFAKSDSEKDLIKTEAAMHEFNMTVLDDRLNEHRIRMIEIMQFDKPKKKKGKKK